MDRVQEVDEATLFPAFSRTKWGVGADSDTETSDADGQLPAEAPDLDGPVLPGAPDLHARCRAALLRRSTAVSPTAANAVSAPTW